MSLPIFFRTLAVEINNMVYFLELSKDQFQIYDNLLKGVAPMWKACTTGTGNVYQEKAR